MKFNKKLRGEEGFIRCGKRGYDKKSAQTARNMAERERGKPLRIYHCGDCNLWHLTHVDPYGTHGYY